MSAPNGDSLDGFVFPPFIPTASRAAPAPPPAPPAPPAGAGAVEAGPGRATMPWDAETPIVRDAAADGGHEDGAADEDGHEDLPWLEVPAPRAPAAPAVEPSPPDAATAGAELPAADAGLPEWMAWGPRDEAEAAREMGNVDPVAGLENLVPMHDAPAAPEAHAPVPAQAETRPEPSASDAEFLSASLGGGDFLLRALQASQVPPAADAGEPAPAAAAPVEVPARPDPFTAASVAQAEAVAPADASATQPVPAVSPPEQPAAVTHALADGFGEVAGRLEGIARTLRERPDELLSGGSDDPLALLVTGYVLGYAQGRRA